MRSIYWRITIVLDFAYGEAGILDPSWLDEDNEFYGISYLHRQSSSLHGFEVSWLRKDSEGRALSMLVEEDLETIGVGYIYYLNDGFTLGVDASRAALSRNFSFNSLDIDQKLWSYGISARRMFELANDRWFVFHGGLELKDGDMGDFVLGEIEGIYYFSPETGVSLGVKTADDFENATIDLGFSHYFTERFAVDLLIGHSDDTDEYGLGGKLRF